MRLAFRRAAVKRGTCGQGCVNLNKTFQLRPAAIAPTVAGHESGMPMILIFAVSHLRLPRWFDLAEPVPAAERAR